MKLAYSTLQNIIEITDDTIHSIVVENPEYYYHMVKDFMNQVEGKEGGWIVSENDKPLAVNKNVEILFDFIGINVNQKTLITKILNEMEQIANKEENINETMQLLSDIERFVMYLNEDFDLSITCDKLTISQLLKSVGISISVETDDLIEFIYSYMQLIRQFIGEKLFVFVNFRSFVSQKQFSDFAMTIIGHGYQVIFLENKEYDKIAKESRLIIDQDLCEI